MSTEHKEEEAYLKHTKGRSLREFYPKTYDPRPEDWLEKAWESKKPR